MCPIYEYQCVTCGGRDQRVAGLDDHMSLCLQCSGLMLRLDEDLFQPYFEEFNSECDRFTPKTAGLPPGPCVTRRGDRLCRECGRGAE